jgi:hypothetical protein
MPEASKSIQSAPIDTAVSGDNTIVGAVAGKKIRVLSYVLVGGGAVNARWKSGANNRSGPLPLAANSSVAPPAGSAFLFETNAGEALILNLSAAVQVSGHVSYAVVTPPVAPTAL